jgi:hypothetical protein
MSCIIESPLWRVIIFLNTLLLLFGSEVQDLCIHPEGDIVMDVFFTIVMAAFFFDIIMSNEMSSKDNIHAMTWLHQVEMQLRIILAVV